MLRPLTCAGDPLRPDPPEGLFRTAIQAEIRNQERIWTALHLAEWLAGDHGVEPTPGHLARRFKQVGIV